MHVTVIYAALHFRVEQRVKNFLLMRYGTYFATLHIAVYHSLTIAPSHYNTYICHRILSSLQSVYVYFVSIQNETSRLWTGDGESSEAAVMSENDETKTGE